MVFLFGLRTFKKAPELVPLVSFLALPVVLGLSYMAYGLYQKPDVVLNKNEDLPPFERVDPLQTQKLHTVNQRYAKIPELENLRKDIGSYKN